MEWWGWLVLVALGFGIYIVAKHQAEERRKEEKHAAMLPYMETFERARDSFDLASRPTTMMGKLQVMQASLDKLQEIDPGNDNLINMGRSVDKAKHEVLGEIHKQKVDKLVAKFDTTVALGTKKKSMNEVVLACDDALREGAPGIDWRETKDRTVRAYYTSLVDHFVEKGKKAEFKQQTKVALNHYREALYELTNDDESGIDHTDQIEWLRGRIAKLEAQR